MTSSLPPQEPPTQGPIRPIRFFRNLLLGGETKAEVAKQVKNKVEEIIHKDKLEAKLKDRLKTELKAYDTNLRNLNREYRKMHENKVKEYEKETEEELNKLREKAREKLNELSSKVTIMICVVIAIGLVFAVFANSLLPNITSLDVFQADLERLEEEIEDLKEDPQNN